MEPDKIILDIHRIKVYAILAHNAEIAVAKKDYNGVLKSIGDLKFEIESDFNKQFIKEKR